MAVTRAGMRGGARGRTAARHAEPSKVRTKFHEMAINDVWVLYHRAPTDEVRNFLMERFLPLVRYNAERIHTRLPDEVDVEDLMSAGVFGLMDAIDAFDLERKVKFETYCAPRIRGAILDELRSMDWVPRLVRHRSSIGAAGNVTLKPRNNAVPIDLGGDDTGTQLGLTD